MQQSSEKYRNNLHMISARYEKIVKASYVMSERTLEFEKRFDTSMRLFIYGAKSIALGVCRAMQTLYPSHKVEGFLVSSSVGNPSHLAGLPVMELGEFVAHLAPADKTDIHVLVAAPENIHHEITVSLEKQGFSQYTCITAEKESYLMERYYEALGFFPSLHGLTAGEVHASLCVFAAKFHRDAALQGEYDLPKWIVPIQVGAELTETRVADLQDNAGAHISAKNVNYCELTALYWMWKNVLSKESVAKTDYYGLFHYRRILDISEEDICRLKKNEVDAILPFPLLHEPNAFEHHTRYMQDTDWEAMRMALAELQPEYADAMDGIFAQPYFYNFNMLIAKPEVLEDYCAWLFPILERTEALSNPKGWERSDRYIGYLGENLLTLYFMYNKDKYHIVHTGRRMLV